MKARVVIEKNQSENNASVIRRFTRKMQGTGILNQLRRHRYSERPLSPANRKNQALTRISRREKWNELYKLGKVTLEKKTKRR